MAAMCEFTVAVLTRMFFSPYIPAILPVTSVCTGGMVHCGTGVPRGLISLFCV